MTQPSRDSEIVSSSPSSVNGWHSYALLSDVADFLGCPSHEGCTDFRDLAAQIQILRDRLILAQQEVGDAGE